VRPAANCILWYCVPPSFSSMRELSSPSDLVAPFYKGLLHLKDHNSLAVLTKRDPVTNTPISNETYVELLDRWRIKSPVLIQNVVRASIAVLLANTLQRRGGTPQLISVEGCLQEIGGRTMGGAGIVESIWCHVVPEELMRGLLPPIVENVSDCTVAEARTLLSHVRETQSRLHAITHDYHVARVARTLREEAGSSDAIRVYTPEAIAGAANIRQPAEQFIADIVRVGAIPKATLRKERLLEAFIYWPLHVVSRGVEHATGGYVTVEEWIARRLRTRCPNHLPYNSQRE
jgi:hypothetical protein